MSLTHPADCTWCARGYEWAPMPFYPDAHVGPPLSPAALAQMNAGLCGGCSVAPGQAHMPDCGAGEFAAVYAAPACGTCYDTGALPTLNPWEDDVYYCDCPAGVARAAQDADPDGPAEPYIPWG